MVDEPPRQLMAHLLVQQGENVTAMAPGQVPLLRSDQLREAVNFLRCGFPAVQITSHGYRGEDGWQLDQERYSSEELQRIERYFATIALPGESFPCRPTHLPSDQHDTLVLHVTREAVGGAERFTPHPGAQPGPHLKP